MTEAEQRVTGFPVLFKLTHPRHGVLLVTELTEQASHLVERLRLGLRGQGAESV